jgi:flagellar hook-length control protein FliK
VVTEAQAAAPAPPPPAADQLAQVMRPLQRNADGSYQIKIELRPPELGRVEMRVELRDGVMHASIHAEHAHTEELVRNALDDLRSQLQNDGVNAGRLTVGDQRTNERGNGRPSLGDTPEDADGAATDAGRATPVGSTRSDTLLDVRL